MLPREVSHGAAVGRDYRPPDVQLTPAYQSAPPLATPGASAAALDAWWAGFNDPALTRVVERAKIPKQ